MLGLKLNHVSKRGPWREWFGMNQHIAAETKWQLFHTRHFQMYFIELKVSYFPKGAIDNSQRWFRYWLGAKQATNHYLNQSWYMLPTHICVTWLCELLLKQKQKNYHVGEYNCKYIFSWKSPKGQKHQYTIIGSDHGVVLIRQQAIIGTNDGLVYWSIYASLDLYGLARYTIQNIWVNTP